MAQTIERSKVASFSHPLVETHMVLVIKNPIDAYYYSAFIDQLKGITWMAIGLFCLVFPVFLTVITRFKKKIKLFIERVVFHNAQVFSGLDLMIMIMQTSL